uniref:Uncharacterized protein n=1 Tax=Setaria italica TaxID=4555 RepID=K3YFB9_SETIT
MTRAPPRWRRGSSGARRVSGSPSAASCRSSSIA